MFPLHVVLLGPVAGPAARACAASLLGHTLLEALLHGMRHPPFVCAYVPAGSFKRAAPIYLAGILIGCYAFAAIERAALASRTGIAILIAALALTAILLRRGDRASRRNPNDIEIDEAPEGAVRLGLGG